MCSIRASRRRLLKKPLWHPPKTNGLVDEASAGQHGKRSFIAIAQAGQVVEEVFLTFVGCHSIKVTSHTEIVNLRDFFRSPHVREERGEISLDDWLRTFHATSMKKKLKDADIEPPAKFRRSLVV